MYQELTLVGNLGSDPEMRYLPDGTAVTNFSLATNRRWTDPNTGQPQDETTWFRISAWGKQAENVNQYLTKGAKAMVVGRLTPDPNTGSPRTFTRNDGSVGTSFEVRAFNVVFLSTKDETDALRAQNGATPQPNQNAPARQASYAPAGQPVSANEEDDIPF